MTIQNIDASNATVRKKYSKQEKGDHYAAWKASGMEKSTFCKKHGINLNDFYYWHKLFNNKTSEPTQFSPVIAKMASHDTEKHQVKLEIRLPNQSQLFVMLNENRIVSFIQELCNAASVIR